MDRVEGFGGFHFHYDSTFHGEVDAVADFEFVTLIDYGLSYFSLRLRNLGSSVPAPGRLGKHFPEGRGREANEPSSRN
jgi:hypothetical protein